MSDKVLKVLHRYLPSFLSYQNTGGGNNTTITPNAARVKLEPPLFIQFSFRAWVTAASHDLGYGP